MLVHLYVSSILGLNLLHQIWAWALGSALVISEHSQESDPETPRLTNEGSLPVCIYHLDSTGLNCLSPLMHIFFFNSIYYKMFVIQLSLTLCNPMDYSLLDSSVHGILQAIILEWVAIPFSRGSFQPSGQIQVFCMAGRFFTIWATREAQ